MSEGKEFRDVAGIKETARRLKSEGLPVSEYSLTRAVKRGDIPARIIGRNCLLFYPNVLSWVTCEHGQDNKPLTPSGGIRPV